MRRDVISGLYIIVNKGEKEKGLFVIVIFFFNNEKNIFFYIFIESNLDRIYFLTVYTLVNILLYT